LRFFASYPNGIRCHALPLGGLYFGKGQKDTNSSLGLFCSINLKIVMDAITTSTELKSGTGLVWLSLLTVPIGLWAIGGGPCAGPRNIAGAIILITVGFCAVGVPIYGALNILRNFKLASSGARVLRVVTLVCACLMTVVGGFFLLIGGLALSAFLRS
jgi:hypothetical protein